MNLEVFKSNDEVKMSSREIAEITKSYGTCLGKNDWEKFPSS